MARICEDYGFRVEKSVFECDLSDDAFQALWRKLEATTTEEDSIVDYPIGLLDRKKIRTLGAVRRQEFEKTYVF